MESRGELNEKNNSIPIAGCGIRFPYLLFKQSIQVIPSGKRTKLR